MFRPFLYRSFHIIHLFAAKVQPNLQLAKFLSNEILYKIVSTAFVISMTTLPSGQARARQYRFAVSPLSVNRRQEFDIIKIALYPLSCFCFSLALINNKRIAHQMQAKLSVMISEYKYIVFIRFFKADKAIFPPLFRNNASKNPP